MDSDLYPFESNYLNINGLQYHYIDEGEGEVVVMLHGNPTWSFYYRNLVKVLRSNYRTIVPDHIGCGLSDKPSGNNYPYTLEQRVEDLESLLNHLEIKSNVTLVVHDWGGMIGMCYATRNVSAIKRIVVLNTGAFHLPDGKKFPWMLTVCQNPLLGPVLVRGFNAFCLSAIRYCAKKNMEDRVKKAYLEPYNSWHNRIAVLRFVQDIPLAPDHQTYRVVSQTQDNLHKLTHIPMLICWGEKDFVFDMDFFTEWVRYFPQAKVHRFPDAGHYILEDACDEIIPLVSDFLTNNV